MDEARFPGNGRAAAVSGVNGGKAGKAGRGAITVLLAEDEHDIRDLITVILREAGYEVIAVGDGEAAVRAFAEKGGEVDFLLFDLIMPQKNGWQAYREISRMRPGIPHLFMSGFMGNVLQEDQEDQTDDDFETTLIRKPFTPVTLVAKVEDLLRYGVQGGARKKG